MWAESLIKAITFVLDQVIYTLNATHKVDTLANRPAVPALNEIMYTASDVQKTWVAVNGAWQFVGGVGVLVNRNGRQTLGSGVTTVNVTLSPAEADTTYQVFTQGTWASGVIRVTTYATGSFTLNWSTATPTANEHIDWMIIREF